MKLYIYKNVDDITVNYHSGGGLLIITEQEPIQCLRHYFEIDRSARKQAGDDWYLKDATQLCETWQNKSLPEPDYVLDVNCNSDLVVIFPDGGCC